MGRPKRVGGAYTLGRERVQVNMVYQKNVFNSQILKLFLIKPYFMYCLVTRFDMMNTLNLSGVLIFS